MEWRYSDPSEDEVTHGTQSTSRKRSSRACDQCRKTKSKCEQPGGESVPCKNCALVGTACTFLGPSYKRGPPKGYIHAIEQRWHQVESLLGAIIQCPDPRVQGFVSDLRQDDLAREIIHRVDVGPYGPSGRRSQPEGATKEDFFASILKSSESSISRDSARSRRQSRVSREIVSSNQDHGLSVVPTKEWQDNLSDRLANSGKATPHTGYDSSRSLPQRRKLNGSGDVAGAHPEWNNMYVLDAGDDASNDAAEGIGGLSLDEHQEVRFHGKASGLHLLSRSDRTDDRIEGGIWRLPMARVWPASKERKPPTEPDTNVPLPSIQVQDRLLDLFFTYVHPVFPVIHRTRFLSEYNLRKHNGPSIRSISPESGSSASPRPEPSQEVTLLLLFSIFTITARFCEDAVPPPPKGKMWEAGCDYLDSARAILTRIFHQARPSTVQSLLLLGYREFGIGSMEQGWIFIGMAIRMAMDLGLNRDSSTWKIHGHNLFSPEEIQTRRQIWWSCCLADRYGSVYMGRPIVIKDDDFDTPLPDIDQEEDNLPWPPVMGTNLGLSYPPISGQISSNFRALATLSIISGAIVSNIYPVRQTTGSSKRALLAELETRLDQWFISLPEELRYETTSRRPLPPPQTLFLHIRYRGAVLLLHRAFIPNWKGTEPTSRNTLELKAFDLAQGAASHISAIVTAYREGFTLKRSSAFLTSYILSAAIMHILTLTLRPSNLQASLGFQQCMAALKDMEMVWPSAARAWELLNGVKLGSNSTSSSHTSLPDRNKRHAEDAFGEEKSSNYIQMEAFNTFNSGDTSRGHRGEDGVQELGTRIMAHMLGLHIPGIEPSTSYYPGYEWWPRQPDASSSHPISPVPPEPRNVLPHSAVGMHNAPDWSQSSVPTNSTYNFEFGRF